LWAGSYSPDDVWQRNRPAASLPPAPLLI